MKVSIIIPVYNVEKYLSRCLDSVIKQTYKNIEIVLVDDGAKDRSADICENYAKIDGRILVIHKENGGLSSARNVGIESCEGDCIYFLDSDDYITHDCIENLVEFMEKYDADISIMQMMYIEEHVNDEVLIDEDEYMLVFDSKQAIEESLYQRLFTCCAPSKLYKRSVVGETRFPVERLSEDLATCHLFLDKGNTIVYSNKYGYYYRQHDNSIMHTFNPKRLDALEWAKNIEQFCAVKYPNIIQASLCRTFNVAIHLLLDLPQTGEMHDRYFKTIWTEVKRTRLSVLLNRKVRFRERAASILSFAGEKVLRAVWNSKLAIRKD